MSERSVLGHPSSANRASVFPDLLRTLKPSSAANGISRRALAIAGTILLLCVPIAFAQFNPTLSIDEDCQTFAISLENQIVYSVPHMRRVQHRIVERDELWITPIDRKPKMKRILDPDKFMPIPPPSSYTIDSLAWSPNGHFIAMGMTTLKPAEETEASEEIGNEQHPAKKPKEQKRKENRGNLGPVAPPVIGKQVVLLDNEGHEIKVAGSKGRFIENGMRPAWLADNSSVVYLTGGGPYQIVRVRPSNGTSKTLFDGHALDAIVWDTPRNRAFAIGSSLSPSGHRSLVELDLLHETVREIARADAYKGGLAISLSGDKIGYFADGDTVTVLDVAHPENATHLQIGYGRFEWGKDDKHILLKRGTDDQSNDLLWIGVYDGSFTPILHDLTFDDFHISPNGDWLAVTQPGKRAMQVYSLR